VRVRLLASILLALLLLAAAPALAQARPPTPDLIQRAEDAGRLDRSRADLFRAYAIAAPERLPAAFRSDAPWDGTLTLLQIQRDLPRLREAEREEIQALLAAEASNASCGAESTSQMNVLETTHFRITYDTVGAGLTAADYGASLEEAWQTEVESFGWAPPPVAPSPAPGSRYHVRIDDLTADGLFGFVSVAGTHAGFVGNNPATAWNDVDAYASCMVLNADYTGFSSSPQAALDSTTGHEFNHSIQFGIGGLVGSNLPDEVFVEGGATWMEDEVQDAADDNYNYLWPDFGESMGDYDPSTFAYPYWITFRGLTERYGTGTPGGGEQVMQDFWELTSQNAESNQNAIAAALDARGTTLADAFHAYAVAVKFNRPCGGGGVYPYCFEEGPRYESAAGTPPVNRTIASVGGGTTFSVEDNYALAWVALPSSSGEYNVTLNNTSSAGQLRGTVACETGSELRLSPLPAVAASGGSSTLVAFNPVGCTSRVLVVTNQSQTAANPNNSASRSFSVTTAAAPLGTHTLSVTRTGSGSGTVVSNPTGINCGGDCSQGYASGTSVTLTATPAADSSFAGWDGDCSGTAPCTVTMNGSRSVTAAFNLLVDNTAPQTTITDGTSGQTSDSTPTFSFTSSETGSTFTCQIDGGTPFACASPYTTSVLADGQHTFSVFARDTAGNPDLSPATRSFTVAGGTAQDTDPPETTITGGPAGTTSDNTPTFSFSSDEANSTFVCQVDQGLALPCGSPHTTETLGAGHHVFSVYARDSAGNPDPTPATRDFTVGAGAAGGDVVAPAISRLRLSPTRFRAARSGAALTAAVGTRVSLTLSEAATVTFRVSRLLPGRRVGGRCVRPAAGNRGAPRCTRSVRLRGRIVRELGAGTSRLRYRGRLAGRRLRPGRYLLLARARDTAGNRSTPRRARFVIVR
jgi:hypothetical protein